MLDPPSYQSLFLHLCSTRQSLPSIRFLMHSLHRIKFDTRRIRPYAAFNPTYGERIASKHMPMFTLPLRPTRRDHYYTLSSNSFRLHRIVFRASSTFQDICCIQLGWFCQPPVVSVPRPFYNLVKRSKFGGIFS